MALEQLVDCSTMMIGATQLARPESAEFWQDDNPIESECDAVDGSASIDGTYWDLRATLTAQDPLSVPTVAALTSSYEIAATGQLVNTPTYRTLKMAHGVLSGIDLEIADAAHGRSTYQFVNCATGPAVTKDQEYTSVAGSAPTFVNRRCSIRIIAGSSTFTPDGGLAITLEGLSRLRWSASARRLYAGASPGALCVDQVAIGGWSITGSISLLDKTLGTGSTLAARLASSPIGTLVVAVRVTGFANEAVAPSNAVFTFQRIKFGRTSEGLRSKAQNTGDLTFRATLLDVDNDLLTLANMVSVA